jgi:histidyl-tRNA synthetase
VIFEAVLTQYQYDPQLGDDQFAVGSVAGGGRYDELVQKLDPRQRRVPCIGASVGVERIFAIKEHQMAMSNIQTKTIETEVYIASAQKNLIEERMKLCAYLWANGFKV